MRWILDLYFGILLVELIINCMGLFARLTKFTVYDRYVQLGGKRLYHIVFDRTVVYLDGSLCGVKIKSYLFEASA